MNDLVTDLFKGKTLGKYMKEISFDKETMKALEDACVHKQREITGLVEDIIKDWLRRNLYLAKGEPSETYLKGIRKEK